jgi:hypothetical protein
MERLRREYLVERTLWRRTVRWFQWWFYRRWKP